MKKKSAKKKKASPPQLKNLEVALCLNGDFVYSHDDSQEWTPERDVFIESYFSEKVKSLRCLSYDLLDQDTQTIAFLYDVLITHVPADTNQDMRDLFSDTRSQDIISEETFWFSEYSRSLAVIRKLAHAGLPVIGYTKAAEPAIDIIQKTGYFHDVIQKTDYFKKDCALLTKSIREACGR